MKPSFIPRSIVVALLLATVPVQARSYLLVTNDPSLPRGIENAVAAAGGRVTLLLPQIGVAVVESESDRFVATAGKIPGISSVLPDVAWQTETPVLGATESIADDDAAANAGPTVTDTRFPIQWGLKAVNAPGAWAAGQLGAGVRVAVLDSGIASSHVDLALNVNTVLSTSFVPGEAFNYTYAGAGTSTFNHGTHVAGIIASRINGTGAVGVAPQAEIVAVKVLRTRTGTGSFSWIMAGIVYAAEINADIVNMSLGGNFPRRGYLSNNGTPNDPSDDYKVGANELSALVTALGRATQFAHQRGVTIIASAGNSAIDRDHDADMWVLPADCPHVIAVSATSPVGWAKNLAGAFLDQPTSYTNYGQSRIALAAPGGDFLYTPRTEMSIVFGVTAPTYVFDGVYSPSNRIGNTTYWAWAAGTSMAAPHVSGIAALIIGKHGGPMHPAAVEAALRAAADDLGKPGKDDYYGHGRVNAAQAVD